MTIEPADFDDPSVLALLRLHLEGMHASSPPGTVFALDLTGLKSPDVAVFILREGETAVGMGALKELDVEWGELKSMRTHPDHLRKGIAAKILEHLLAEARQRGYRRLSLETGTGEAFEPAVALYRRYGFRNGEVFGGYPQNDFSQFLHLTLMP
jgi:putative acetyltransferase